MIRPSDFITKIRNCKTMAQERAQTQKEMAAIRQSFSKNQDSYRLRNVTKLLFINMMGQDTDFGQMECLKLITAPTFIQKRIGYLGLTQLFHQRSELLMMATHRLRIDLTSGNNYIVGLTLSVLSQICTNEHAKQLAPQIIKLVGNSSSYIKKKAILTGSKVIRKSPEFIPQFLQKIQTILDDKHHGVLLGVMGFLETTLSIDQSHVPKLSKLVQRLTKVYKTILSNHSPEYQISGTNDPFLQVAILKFMRSLLKYDKSISADVTAILLQVHQYISSKNSASLKNGANSVLFQCFQTLITLQITPQLKQMISNIVSKFVSVKDPNSKYLTLYTLNLLAKYDINSVQNHRKIIYECLSENDILIRVMALDLLYLIANLDNVVHIIKDLLNTLLKATDEEFTIQLSLKICLIVDKQAPSRRWHFDTILKVLILAGHAVKEESTTSLVHLISCTPQLQTYAMIKLFFASTENTQNQTLSKIVLYLLGEYGQILLRAKQVKITEDNILTLIQNILLRVGASDDTVSYGLNSLFKLVEKTNQKFRILGTIKSFQNHSNLQVQKRACEYSKLLQTQWDSDRKKQICIPIPVLATAVDVFKQIPIGSTEVNLQNPNIILPQKIQRPRRQQVKTAIVSPSIQTTLDKNIKPEPIQKKQVNIFDQIEDQNVPVQIQKVNSTQEKKQTNIFDEDIFFGEPQKQVVSSINRNNQLGNMNLLTGIMQPPIQTIFPQQTQPLYNTNQVFNNNFFSNTPVSLNNNPNLLSNLQQPNNALNLNLNPNTNNNNLLGFNTLQSNTNSLNQSYNNQPILNNNNNINNNNINNNTGLNLLGFQQPPQQIKLPSNTPINNTNTNSIFRAYENQHLQIMMNCVKQSADTTNIVATFNNKSRFVIQNLTLQVAVMKHLKLTMNPLNTTRLQPLSKDSVNQKMKLVNTTVGQKGIVMKIKLIYNVNGEKISEQGKISNFPQGY